MPRPGAAGNGAFSEVTQYCGALGGKGSASAAAGDNWLMLLGRGLGEPLVLRVPFEEPGSTEWRRWMLYFIQQKAWKIGLICALLLCVMSWRPAVNAQANVSARVLWYGIFTMGKRTEINDPNSPTGKRYLASTQGPRTNSAAIPARQLSFGVGYVFAGPRRGTPVNVKHVYRFPAGGMPDTGSGVRTTYEENFSLDVGQTGHIGWSFSNEYPQQIVPGAWVFEVWVDGRRLIEQQFTVGP